MVVHVIHTCTGVHPDIESLVERLEELHSYATESGIKQMSPNSFPPRNLTPCGRLFKLGGINMSKETPKDDPRQRSDQGSHKQTEKPWEGNPEKEQRNSDADLDLEKWDRTNTH